MDTQDTPVTAETEEVIPQVVTAPAWPRDVYGITSDLRRALARVAGRLNGDDEKFDVLMRTLREGADWARKRMEIQKAYKASTLARLMQQTEKDNAEMERLGAERNIPSTDERAKSQREAGIQGSVTSTAQ